VLDSCNEDHVAQAASHEQNKKADAMHLLFVLVAEMGFEPHGLVKFSAENLTSVTSRL
jgi:hypothetical protein